MRLLVHKFLSTFYTGLCPLFALVFFEPPKKMLAFIFFAAVVASLAYFWVQKRFTFWKKLGYPEAPISFPFGSLKGMGSEIPICLGIDGIYNSFKGRAKAVGLYFFFSPVLMATDLDLIKNIFIRDFSSFHDRGLYYNKKDDPMSANLVSQLASSSG